MSFSITYTTRSGKENVFTAESLEQAGQELASRNKSVDADKAYEAIEDVEGGLSESVKVGAYTIVSVVAIAAEEAPAPIAPPVEDEEDDDLVSMEEATADLDITPLEQEAIDKGAMTTPWTMVNIQTGEWSQWQSPKGASLATGCHINNFYRFKKEFKAQGRPLVSRMLKSHMVFVTPASVIKEERPL